MAKTAPPKTSSGKTSSGKTSSGKTVLSLKVTLRSIKPPIWRRLLVPPTMTLGHLHIAIQAAMGWHNCHLHAFDIDARQYGDRQTVDDVADENRLTLNGLLKSGGARFDYTYDFGDGWEHTIAVEKNQPALEPISYPICIPGKRNCPPEDCGGPWAYQDLIASLADPSHPDHKEQREWIDQDFDPDPFDIKTANTVRAAQFTKK